MSSKLYLVPTPIGNLEDMSFRAIKVLQSVDIILAEDTRNAGVLLKHFSIEKRLLSHHQHNEHQAVNEIVRLIKEGKNIALISDAGTPAISDPGFLLVRACIAEDILVECLPGATAFVPALVCSGFACDKFYFEGFLPQKKGRLTRLKYISTLSETVILYESPHRIHKLIEELLLHVGPDRKICISREISKKFEEHMRGTVQEFIDKQEELLIKGELVVCIEGLEQKKKNKSYSEE